MAQIKERKTRPSAMCISKITKKKIDSIQFNSYIHTPIQQHLQLCIEKEEGPHHHTMPDYHRHRQQHHLTQWCTVSRIHIICNFIQVHGWRMLRQLHCGRFRAGWASARMWNVGNAFSAAIFDSHQNKQTNKKNDAEHENHILGDFKCTRNNNNNYNDIYLAVKSE